MIAVASEIERLRGELANAEKGATTVNPAAPVANSGIILNLPRICCYVFTSLLSLVLSI